MRDEALFHQEFFHQRRSGPGGINSGRVRCLATRTTTATSNKPIDPISNMSRGGSGLVNAAAKADGAAVRRAAAAIVRATSGATLCRKVIALLLPVGTLDDCDRIRAIPASARGRYSCRTRSKKITG